jgi:YHS domain-containing protein
MKTMVAAALALVVGGIVGCSSSSHDDHQYREGQLSGPVSDRDASTRMQSDPVCGHSVNPLTAIKETYGEQTFYFDTARCAERFRDNPHVYLPGGDDRDLEGRRVIEAR